MYPDYNGNRQYNNSNNSFNSMNNVQMNYQNNSGYNSPQVGNNEMFTPKKEKFDFGKIFIPITIILIISGVVFGFYIFFTTVPKRNRTFMIYMVGSDLESKSKQGTYSISEIVGQNIDLVNNNVILMVGGSKKWHNFVDPEEIGIYKLKKDGFEKIKSLPVENMGTSANLTSFLDYAYKHYPANNYDLIFWNHGLGAMGIEQDELSSDYLSINELNKALADSEFNDHKLELTIFYNCLASNLHIAKIMSNYSDYMVASEEIFYLSKVLNRLNFLERVRNNLSAYDIGRLFIDQSDKVVYEYNESHMRKIDSTLSILDLSKISELDKKLNTFINTIDINKNYYSISNIRRSLFTFGTVQTNDYDVVDLYELISALVPYSTNKSAYSAVVDELNKVVSYTSNLNDHSNGLSVYFPYYGSDTAVEIHLNAFDKLWDDSYTNFIKSFYNIRSGARQLVRSETNSNVNYLKNRANKESNNLSITLTDEEKEKYQSGNVYLFKKENDRYILMLKSNKVELIDNKIVFNDNKLLKVDNNIVTFVNDSNYYNYGSIGNSEESFDVINVLDDNLAINQTTLDSGDYPHSGLIELDDYDKMSFYNLSYDLLNDEKLNEEWKEDIEKTIIEVDKNNMKLELFNNDLSEYYVMFEVFDEHNDSYYSYLTEIK